MYLKYNTGNSKMYVARFATSIVIALIIIIIICKATTVKNKPSETMTPKPKEDDDNFGSLDFIDNAEEFIEGRTVDSRLTLVNEFLGEHSETAEDADLLLASLGIKKVLAAKSLNNLISSKKPSLQIKEHVHKICNTLACNRPTNAINRATILGDFYEIKCGGKIFGLSKTTAALSTCGTLCCDKGLITVDVTTKEEINCLTSAYLNNLKSASGQALVQVNIYTGYYDNKTNNYHSCNNYSETPRSELWANNQPNNDSLDNNCVALVLSNNASFVGFKNMWCASYVLPLCQKYSEPTTSTPGTTKSAKSSRTSSASLSRIYPNIASTFPNALAYLTTARSNIANNLSVITNHFNNVNSVTTTIQKIQYKDKINSNNNTKTNNNIINISLSNQTMVKNISQISLNSWKNMLDIVKNQSASNSLIKPNPHSNFVKNSTKLNQETTKSKNFSISSILAQKTTKSNLQNKTKLVITSIVTTCKNVNFINKTKIIEKIAITTVKSKNGDNIKMTTVVVTTKKLAPASKL